MYKYVSIFAYPSSYKFLHRRGVVAELVVLAGGMFGDKTDRIISMARRLDYAGSTGAPYHIFKPAAAQRGEGACIKSRTERQLPCTLFHDPLEIVDVLREGERRLTERVFIEEAHMAPHAKLSGIIEALLERRIGVTASCLSLDYGGRLFPIMGYFLTRGAEMIRQYGVCSHPSGCRDDGTHSQLFFGEALAPYTDNPLLAGGFTDMEHIRYEPRCRKHFIVPPNHPEFVERGVCIEQPLSYETQLLARLLEEGRKG